MVFMVPRWLNIVQNLNDFRMVKNIVPGIRMVKNINVPGWLKNVVHSGNMVNIEVFL